MASNAVFRKGADGRWRTGDDEKVLRLKRIFRAMDREGMGYLSASALLAAMRQRNNELHTVFGPQKADSMLAAFARLDSDGSGVVTEDEFVARAEVAFREYGDLRRGGAAADPSALAVSSPPAVDVPAPPPMTRELLYRSIFLEIDQQRKGYVTLADIVRVLNARLPSVREVFGQQDAARAVQVFSALDHSGEGKVAWRDFFECAELAFTKHASAGPLETVEGEPIAPGTPAPHPPPMTRELLYRSVFSEVDANNSGEISQMQLVKAMNKRRSSIALIFGAAGTDSALTAFRRMDTEGDGRVSFQQFFDTCEEAFYESETDDEDEAKVDLPPAAVEAPVPQPTPPPMTRERLYRAVWDSIDTRKKGFISQLDLVACVRGPHADNLANIFGVDSVEKAIAAFSAIDADGEGRITWVQFFDQAEAALVAQAEQRQQAPRRESLAPVATAVPAGRRPSYIAPPPLPEEPLVRAGTIAEE